MHSVQMDNCSICSEFSGDLKCIPCWHNICKTCVIGIKGKKRKTTCPLCRDFFLCDNMETLPNPILCNFCQQFVVKPQQFKSCSHVYCLECVATLRRDRQGVCYDCDYGLQSEAMSLLICQRCHRFHNNVEIPCRPDMHPCHSLCENCFQQDPVCTLCKVIDEDKTRSLRMDKIARIIIQNVRSNPQVGSNLHNPASLMSSNQTTEGNELGRTIAFTIFFFLLGFYFGIGYQLWLATIGIYFLIRPNSIFIALLTSMCLIWLRILFIYYHFYVTLKILAIHYFLVFMVNIFCKLDDLKKSLMFVIFDSFFYIYLPLFHNYPILYLHCGLLALFQTIFLAYVNTRLHSTGETQ